MKNLGKFLNDTADQIFSTFVLAFLIYSMVKGTLALLENFPSLTVLAGIFAVGFILGTLKFLSND